MSLQQSLGDALRTSPEWLGLLLIGASACIEYLFPPFPGDVLVIVGGIWVTRRGWSNVAGFSSILIGSLIGMIATTLFGRWLGQRPGAYPLGLERVRPQIQNVLERFRARGAVYIAINRFLPSLRALFFIAAGMAKLPVGRVLLFGTLSAILWNGMLWFVAAKVGENWSALGHFFRTYSYVAWALCAVVIITLLLKTRTKPREL